MHTGLRGFCIANTRPEARSTVANGHRANQTASAPLPEQRSNRGTARLRRAQRRHQAVDLADRRLKQPPAPQLAMDGDRSHLRRSATRSDLPWRTSVAIRQASQMGQAVPQSQAGRQEPEISRLRPVSTSTTQRCRKLTLLRGNGCRQSRYAQRIVISAGRSATQETWGYLDGCRYVLHDRHTKFCPSFRSVVAAGGVKTMTLPARSPNLNAFAER